MQIEGVDVAVPENLVYHLPGNPRAQELKPGSVLLVDPGHPLNQTDAQLLVCDLATYASLDAMPDVRESVAEVVRSSRRAMRAKERNAARLERRKERRAQWRRQSERRNERLSEASRTATS